MQYIIPLIVIFLSISSAAEEFGTQHLIVGFHGTEPKNEEVQQAQQLLREGLIRGVILFRHNIDNPHQLKRLTEFLLKSGRKDMIISIDQEGGAVSRMDQANGFAFTMPSAASYETAEAVYEQFYNVGKMLKEYNINLNFAPVLDVDENKSSPVIGKIARSFSGNVDTVVEYGAAAIQGLREGGIVPYNFCNN